MFKHWIRTTHRAVLVAGLAGLMGCDSSSRENSQQEQSLLSEPERLVDAREPEPSATGFWNPVPVSPSTYVPTKIIDEYWQGQFERVNREVQESKGAKLVFFGDSITMDWTLLRGHGKAVWEERFVKYQPINMGNSGDITPVMLFRVTNGNLDFSGKEAPQVAVLLCGTNNYVVSQSAKGKEQWGLGIDTPPNEVADGVRAVAQAFRRQLPGTRVILLSILPVKDAVKWEKVEETNRILGAIEYPKDEVSFMDLTDHFMNADGTLVANLYTDGTHLTPDGYKVLGKLLAPEIERLMALGPLENP